MRRAAGIAGLPLLLAGAFLLGLLLTRGEADGESLGWVPRDRPPQVIDEVRSELVTGYYRRVPSRVLAEDTIDAVIAGLDDPYTDYLTPHEYGELRARTARRYSGVGLTVSPAKEGLVVKSAVEGPAYDAGIRPGNLIVSVDGRPTTDLSFDRSLDLIKGVKGTVVRLRIRRPHRGVLSFDVKRDDIQLPAVRARIVRAGRAKAGYLHVLSFRASAAEQLAQRMRALVKKGASGVVLDLRGNPGGLLSEAVRTVSLLVGDGLVCVTRGLHEGRRAYRGTGRAAYPKLPVVVLVDRESASAAEIVAAALGDHERATVVGERTYGKAAVQSVRELSNGAALKMTTAVFLTPEGRNLTERGLAPDVRATDDPRTRRDEALAAAEAALAKKLV